MANYKHGVYSEQIPYSGNLATQALGTVPVYIGTLPVHQLNSTGAADFDYSKLVNMPILLSSYNDAVSKCGYSDDWKNWTLGEAISAHFLNGDTPIAPIVVINMANPKDLDSTDTVETVTLSGGTGNKVGYLYDSRAAIEHVVITASASLTASDYTLTYEGDAIRINIKKTGFASATCTATYKRIDTSDTAITATDFETALNAIDLCETAVGVIPNILVAPKYSKNKAYHDKMIAKVIGKFSAKWYAICVSDIPATVTTNTPSAAIAWKDTNGYNSRYDKVCFPMVQSAGKIYHLSTLAVVDMQYQDTLAGGVPYVSPSNKRLYASGAVLENESSIYIDEPTANGMNEKGITTTNIVRGELRLWGGHMANYNFATIDSISPEDRSDSSIRMMVYLCNNLQYQYIDGVDKTIRRRDVDSILASIQQWLNSLVNEGKLLSATIDFNAEGNPASDRVNGDFVFNVTTTTAPNVKSITFRVQYTTDGIGTLTGGNE